MAEDRDAGLSPASRLRRARRRRRRRRPGGGQVARDHLGRPAGRLRSQRRPGRRRPLPLSLGLLRQLRIGGQGQRPDRTRRPLEIRRLPRSLRRSHLRGSRPGRRQRRRSQPPAPRLPRNQGDLRRHTGRGALRAGRSRPPAPPAGSSCAAAAAPAGTAKSPAPASPSPSASSPKRATTASTSSSATPSQARSRAASPATAPASWGEQSPSSLRVKQEPAPPG